jgi:hypothetical protein
LNTFDLKSDGSPVAAYRTHTINFAETPSGAEVGIFAYDTTNTRILLRAQRGGEWSVVKWSKALDAVEHTYASGICGDTPILSATVKAYKSGQLVMSAGSAIATVVFAEGDIYYDPTGKAGGYVGGYHYGDIGFKPAVGVSSYTVGDVYG